MEFGLPPGWWSYTDSQRGRLLATFKGKDFFLKRWGTPRAMFGRRGQGAWFWMRRFCQTPYICSANPEAILTDLRLSDSGEGKCHVFMPRSSFLKDLNNVLSLNGSQTEGLVKTDCYPTPRVSHLVRLKRKPEDLH